MNYPNTCEAIFIDRPNRFIAHVDLDGKVETVHVKNTGRCKELLLPGVKVILSKSENPARKTAYDLIGVYKDDTRLFNIDSQAPNLVVGEWLQTQGFSLIKPEYTFGDSRIDFYMERDSERWLLEVKGCTLERDGAGFFPDAPTERGVKHLRELAKAAEQGWCCAVAFVIQVEGITEVRPNTETHPAFGDALAAAATAGVRVLHLPCRVRPDSLAILETGVILR